jgi:hypothetical protein
MLLTASPTTPIHTFHGMGVMPMLPSLTQLGVQQREYDDYFEAKIDATGKLASPLTKNVRLPFNSLHMKYHVISFMSTCT